jgi:hypothetical protein
MIAISERMQCWLSAQTHQTETFKFASAISNQTLVDLKKKISLTASLEIFFYELFFSLLQLLFS